MEERRIERQAERSIHNMLQDTKAERDLEKQIQEEDDWVKEQEDLEIEEELEEIYEESPRTKEDGKDKSYWNQPLPGGLKPSGQRYKLSQIRSVNQPKNHKGPVPQRVWAWQGPPSKGCQEKDGNSDKKGELKKGKRPKEAEGDSSPQQHLAEE